MFNSKLFLFVLFALLFSAQPSFSVPIKILPLGDSITSGDGPSAPDALPSYRRDLWKMLKNAGYDIDFVGSRSNYSNTTIATELQDFDEHYDGWPALTAVQINSNLPTYLAGGDTADVALVHVGTNDILSNPSYDPATDNPVIMAAIEAIIDQLQVDNPAMTILVAKIIPLNSPDETTSLNALITSVWATAQSAGSSTVIAVDLNSPIDLSTDYWDAVLHPNAFGENKMATAWFDALVDNNLVGSGNAGTPIVPTAPPVTTNLTLWLDARDVDADGVEDSGIIDNELTLWKDRSGQNNHVGIVVGAVTPTQLDTTSLDALSNKPVVDFDGTNSLVSSDDDQITTDNDYTKFVVFKYDAFGGSNNLLASSPFETTIWGEFEDTSTNDAQ